MGKKVKKSTLMFAVEKFSTISIGVMGFGGAGFFLEESGLNPILSLAILWLGAFGMTICIAMHHKFLA